MSNGPRMRPNCTQTNPVDGKVVWDPVKSLWLSSMAFAAIVGGWLTFSWDAAVVAGLLTASTLCFGHSVGLHRLLVHRSFECPLWLEYCMVFVGTMVGMGGPRRILYMHDIRDWSQRQPACHAFYVHQNRIWKDWFWNQHCRLRLKYPPDFVPEDRVTASRFYRALDRYWMLAQLPLACLLFVIGGWPWVVWGICVRITVSLTGHWFIGFLAHNGGPRSWHVEGAAVQGYNVHGFGLITMGEAWHNNHHAFPNSARLGLERGQYDPGWWLLKVLQRLGLVWNLNLPEHHAQRPELVRIETDEKSADYRKTSVSGSPLLTLKENPSGP